MNVYTKEFFIGTFLIIFSIKLGIYVILLFSHILTARVPTGIQIKIKNTPFLQLAPFEIFSQKECKILELDQTYKYVGFPSSRAVFLSTPSRSEKKFIILRW